MFWNTFHSYDRCEIESRRKKWPGKTSPNVGGNKKINASCLGWAVKKKPLICKLCKTNHPLLWPAHFLKICNLPQIRSNRNISLQFKSWNQPKVESVNADLACLVVGFEQTWACLVKQRSSQCFRPPLLQLLWTVMLSNPCYLTHCLVPLRSFCFGTHYHDKLCCFGTPITSWPTRKFGANTTSFMFWTHSCSYCCSSFDAEQKQAQFQLLFVIFDHHWIFLIKRFFVFLIY